eukprot:NODE_5938_length_895_cov_83.215026_g5710_i0.p1 GENE.NODE_5938_length_895_cov_83.215026_g5710_i0~~NODE_5938_length_895_cov_83.215026_g5710_i0.p1  ORF type:complete len:244 (+),score=23.94 NODE_5938_length_895_cov_83.215026_g5710_i0:68-799(+)
MKNVGPPLISDPPFRRRRHPNGRRASERPDQGPFADAPFRRCPISRAIRNRNASLIMKMQAEHLEQADEDDLAVPHTWVERASSPRHAAVTPYFFRPILSALHAAEPEPPPPPRERTNFGVFEFIRNPDPVIPDSSTWATKTLTAISPQGGRNRADFRLPGEAVLHSLEAGLKAESTHDKESRNPVRLPGQAAWNRSEEDTAEDRSAVGAYQIGQAIRYCLKANGTERARVRSTEAGIEPWST